jgi:hypothetical protein
MVLATPWYRSAGIEMILDVQSHGKSCAPHSITFRQTVNQWRSEKGYDTFCDTPRNNNLGKSLNTCEVREDRLSGPDNRP